MNIVEVAQKLKSGQFAYSKDTGDRITKIDDYHLYYVNPDNDVCDKIDFNPNVWCDDSWEIEIEWVDFWTAWQARKERGVSIRSENWHNTIHFDILNTKTLNEDEINSKWQILD